MSFFLFAFLTLTAGVFASPPTEGIVAVAVPPYRYIVHRLAGDQLRSLSIAPEGADPHTFSPTITQCSELAKADVWLMTGEPFETKCLTALGRKSAIEILDLRTTTSLLPAPGSCQHAHPSSSPLDAMDTHLWLSPKRLAEQSVAIARTLAGHFPKLREQILKNSECLVRELKELESDLKGQLALAPRRAVLVAHPALTYFCADFNLVQISAEFSGREPTSQQQTQLLLEIQARGIDRIFILKPHSERAARRIAQVLNLQIEVIAPYSYNPLQMLRELTAMIAQPAISTTSEQPTSLGVQT